MHSSVGVSTKLLARHGKRCVFIEASATSRVDPCFFQFFGIASWKRYNDEDVYISCTEQYSNNIRPPGITICPGLRNRYHNILANPCSSKNGTLDIVSCIEEASFSLSDVVLDVRGGYHDQGEDDQLDASEWTQDFAIETILKIMTN